MNRFFKRLPLLAKLMLIGLVPFAFMIFLTFEVYNYKSEKLKLFTNYQSYIAESANINGLIDALQEERKYSFDYVLTKGPRKELILQRPHTDAYIQKLVQIADPALANFTDYTKLNLLPEIRRSMDTFGLKADDIMQYYSNTVFRLNSLNTIPPANTAYLQPVYTDLMTQNILSEMITHLGIIRSNVYNLLYTGNTKKEAIINASGTYEIYKSYAKELEAKGSNRILDRYNNIMSTTVLKPTTAYIDTLFTNYTFGDQFTAHTWWKTSDEGLNQLRSFQTIIWNRVHDKINKLYQAEEKSRNQTLLLLILAIALAIVVITYMVFIISRTLQELKNASERLAEGEADVPISIYSDDMIGRLAQAVRQIDKNNKALANAAVAIGNGNFSVPVSPRSSKDALGNAIVQMQQELNQYRNKMEQLVAQRTSELARSNEDLQQFAHVASHDMKEPLRKIATYSNMLSAEQEAVLSDKGKNYLQKIENAAKRMAYMIEGVLTYSTISATEAVSETVNLNKIMEEVENDLELVIIQKDAQIQYTSLQAVHGIKMLIYQLMYNLVNNALKFSKTGVAPVVRITTAIAHKEDHLFLQNKNNPFVHLVIYDNGIGFRQTYAAQMFGVFSRLNSKDKYEGTGLGLALCKKIALRHGGTIWAEGVEDEGAAFHLLLPASLPENKNEHA